MKMQSATCIVSGMLVLAGIALAHWVNPNWMLLTLLVGLNFILSGFTGFCLLEFILRNLGFRDDSQTKE